MNNRVAIQGERSSNIELLRIISMLMILSLHSFRDPVTLSLDTLTFRTFIDFFREPLSISAVNIFILISGFYSIKWKPKSISSLLFQTYFFIFLISGILLLTGFITFNSQTFFLRLNGIAIAYWFITAYVGLYVLSPVLNAFAEKVNRKQFIVFLVVFYLVQFYYQLFFNPNYASGYSILSFSGLYLIGRFLNLHPIDQTSNNTTQKNLQRIIAFLVITLLITIMAIALKINLSDEGGSIKKDHLFGFIYNNPLVIIQSIIIFLFFKNIHIRSKFINYCASSVLAIYLVHMHPDIKQLFYNYTASLYDHSFIMQIILLLGLFAVIFVISILLDKIRIALFNWLYPIFAQMGNKFISMVQSRYRLIHNHYIDKKHFNNF